eukprot:TRINITY_DN11860_c0_g1_i2.p1 TRINITY_DN11860_c0_g1~~TRINITY_DN11860_c0_g1_i2.p1  ORF type:complete len:1175 (+),score=195.59 TRINITY_DN11860_c0_g1_i2:1248-4772(+)
MVVWPNPPPPPPPPPLQLRGGDVGCEGGDGKGGIGVCVFCCRTWMRAAALTRCTFFLSSVVTKQKHTHTHTHKTGVVFVFYFQEMAAVLTDELLEIAAAARDAAERARRRQAVSPPPPSSPLSAEQHDPVTMMRSCSETWHHCVVPLDLCESVSDVAAAVRSVDGGSEFERTSGGLHVADVSVPTTAERDADGRFTYAVALYRSGTLQEDGGAPVLLLRVTAPPLSPASGSRCCAAAPTHTFGSDDVPQLTLSVTPASARQSFDCPPMLSIPTPTVSVTAPLAPAAAGGPLWEAAGLPSADSDPGDHLAGGAGAGTYRAEEEEGDLAAGHTRAGGSPDPRSAGEGACSGDQGSGSPAPADQEVGRSALAEASAAGQLPQQSPLEAPGSPAPADQVGQSALAEASAAGQLPQPTTLDQEGPSPALEGSAADLGSPAVAAGVEGDGASASCAPPPGLEEEAAAAESGRTHFIDLADLPNPEMLRSQFLVDKHNPDKRMAATRTRVWVLDFLKKQFSSVPQSKTATETLAASTGQTAKQFAAKSMFRTERNADTFSLARISFFGAEHPYDLVFRSARERQMFAVLSRALRGNVVWSPWLCPADADPHPYSVRIAGERADALVHSGRETERQTLKGEVTIQASPVPDVPVGCRVCTLDLQGGAVPHSLDGLIPSACTENFVVIGLLNVGPGGASVGRLAHHLGREYLPLINTEKESTKRSVAVMVFARRLWAVRVTNTGAWSGTYTRKQTEIDVSVSAGYRKVKDKAPSEAVAVSFSVLATPLCFVCISVNVLKDDVGAAGRDLRSEIVADLLSRVDLGMHGVDPVSRFAHFFVLGSVGLTSGRQGSQAGWGEWRRLSELPAGRDRLSVERANGKLLESFQEDDLSFAPDGGADCLRQRVLWKSYPDEVAEASEYRSVPVQSLLGAAVLLRFTARLLLLDAFAAPPPPRVSITVERCQLDCQLQQPDMSASQRRGRLASRAPSIFRSAAPPTEGLMCSVAGSVVCDPYVTLYADWADGMYRSAVMKADADTGLPMTESMPQMTALSATAEFVERQHILFSLKGQRVSGRQLSSPPQQPARDVLSAAMRRASGIGGGRKASVSPSAAASAAAGASGVAPESERRLPYFASGVLSLRDIIQPEHRNAGSGVVPFRVPLAACGVDAKATLVGRLRYRVQSA